MVKLQGKVALVTGGNSGIGRAIANRFAEEGAHVYIVGRREAELAITAAEIGPKATSIQADITNLAELEMIYARIAKDRRKLDIVVANAGRIENRSIAEADEGHFDRIFDLNVRSAFFTVQKAIPLLSDNASVIFVSSSLNVRSDAGSSVYNASKAAVHSLAKTFAVELIPRGARVNTLSPGPVDTPIVETVATTPKEAADFREWAATEVPMGRMGQSKEVAAAALFLASNESSFSTGMELRVDGGHAELQHPQKSSMFGGIVGNL
jgi:NAD(P)-dependent dehydrogenase (short-subunit alcohol dehydrogenase family)